MGRLAKLAVTTTLWLLACSLMSSCTREPAKNPHPQVTQASPQPGDEPLLPLSEEVKRDMKVVRGGNLIVLTMPMSAGQAGVGMANFKLAALPSGCVINRWGPGPKDYWPVIWPGETEIGADGTITASFYNNPHGNFRIGQTVSGGQLAKWPAKLMKPPKEVTDVCPADRYLLVDGLKLVKSK